MGKPHANKSGPGVGVEFSYTGILCTSFMDDPLTTVMAAMAVVALLSPTLGTSAI